MADQDDVRRIALALPGTTEDPTSFRFLVAGKAFAWVWLERFAPKGPRIANAGVLAVRVAGETEKDDLLALDSSVFFTEPHYDGFPAILVRLEAIDEAHLADLLARAWRLQAPARLRRTTDPGGGR
jgi:hypothetical protein